MARVIGRQLIERSEVNYQWKINQKIGFERAVLKFVGNLFRLGRGLINTNDEDRIHV